MYSEMKQRNIRRQRRKRSIRKRVRGTSEKPRMTVFKSNKHLFVQLIDDEVGNTLVSASTIMKELEKSEFTEKSKDSARHIGGLVADKAKKQNIQSVVFDRGHNKFHGLLAEIANAAREAGLQF